MYQLFIQTKLFIQSMAKLFQKELRKRDKLLILAVPLVVLVGIIIYMYASGRPYIRLWPCPFLAATGYDCPGCGATRCVCSIFRLQFYLAIQYNLAVFIYFFPVMAWYIYCIYKVIRRGKFAKIPGWFVWFTLAFFVCFWVVRNFNFYPWHVGSPWSAGGGITEVIYL